MAVYQGGGVWTDTAAVGPMTEGAAGIAVIVLTVLGLASISPSSMAAIAAIVIGVGLMIEAANTGIEYSRTFARRQSGAPETAELGADVTVELLAGGTGVVLGVLALIGAGGLMSLLPAALIVFGGALLLAGLSATRIGTLSTVEPAAGQTVSWRSELSPSRGLQVLIGVAAIVLGVLALVVTAAGTLLMVGLLAVGAALLATSANFTRAFVTMLAH